MLMGGDVAEQNLGHFLFVRRAPVLHVSLREQETEDEL